VFPPPHLCHAETLIILIHQINLLHFVPFLIHPPLPLKKSILLVGGGGGGGGGGPPSGAPQSGSAVPFTPAQNGGHQPQIKSPQGQPPGSYVPKAAPATATPATTTQQPQPILPPTSVWGSLPQFGAATPVDSSSGGAPTLTPALNGAGIFTQPPSAAATNTPTLSPHAPQPRLPGTVATGDPGTTPGGSAASGQQPGVAQATGTGPALVGSPLPNGSAGARVPPRTQSAPPNLKEQQKSAIFLPIHSPAGHVGSSTFHVRTLPSVFIYIAVSLIHLMVAGVGPDGCICACTCATAAGPVTFLSFPTTAPASAGRQPWPPARTPAWRGGRTPSDWRTLLIYCTNLRTASPLWHSSY